MYLGGKSGTGIYVLKSLAQIQVDIELPNLVVVHLVDLNLFVVSGELLAHRVYLRVFRWQRTSDFRRFQFTYIELADGREQFVRCFTS